MTGQGRTESVLGPKLAPRGYGRPRMLCDKAPITAAALVSAFFVRLA
jgi:hypothetical protein